MTEAAPKAIALVAAGLAALLAAAPARAQGEASEATKEAARAKLKEGASLLEAGDPARALADFEEAYRLVPNPKILFNIGLANVGMGRSAAAMRAFDRFVVEAKNAAATNILDAQKQMEALRSKVATVTIKCSEDGIEIALDGHVEGKTPLPGPVYLDPGEHQLVARRDDSTPPTTQAIKAAGGDKTEVTVAPPVTAAPVVVAPPPAVPAAAPMLVAAPPPGAAGDTARPIYRKPWFWGVVGAGVVAVGLTVFLVAGRSTTYPDASLGRISGD